VKKKKKKQNAVREGRNSEPSREEKTPRDWQNLVSKTPTLGGGNIDGESLNMHSHRRAERKDPVARGNGRGLKPKKKNAKTRKVLLRLTGGENGS